jgi:hypothetical protein
MWLAQFVCAPQFFKTRKGLCGHTVYPKHEQPYIRRNLNPLVSTNFVTLNRAILYRVREELRIYKKMVILNGFTTPNVTHIHC